MIVISVTHHQKEVPREVIEFEKHLQKLFGRKKTTFTYEDLQARVERMDAILEDLFIRSSVRHAFDGFGNSQAFNVEVLSPPGDTRHTFIFNVFPVANHKFKPFYKN